ncbi:MAG: hypothetical protein CMH98_15855 [Oceanospirillaceae bacterium]|nr:hypothetical protein [Oceanospirillaceae bacterium]
MAEVMVQLQGIRGCCNARCGRGCGLPASQNLSSMPLGCWLSALFMAQYGPFTIRYRLRACGAVVGTIAVAAGLNSVIHTGCPAGRPR